MTRAVLTLLLVLLAGAGLAGCGETKNVAVATTLPAATLQPLRAGDQPVRLGELRGPAVVNLWANWCGPCRREMPIYQQFHLAHPGVRVLGVDWRDPARDKALAFAKETGVTYPLVVDPDGEVIRNKFLPKLILVDGRGRIAYQAYVEIKSLGQLEGLVRKHLKVQL